MRRASDDVLKQRRVLKAPKLSPQKGSPPRANEEVIRQRKIIKAKRSSFGSPPKPSNNCSTQRPSPPNSAQQATSQPTNSFTPEPNPTHQAEPEEILLVKMSAKLFSREDKEWVKKAKGMLHVYCARSDAQIRWIELLGENNSCFLNLLVEQMLDLSKLIKESAKGKATYIRFTLEKMKGKELMLLQVMPEFLDKLYSALKGED